MNEEPEKTALKPIRPLSIQGLKPATDVGAGPTFAWVKPTDLIIEDSYQRNISEKSITLIRKIVQGWEWARMKPPICARDASGCLFVVDGQHTAIAAASHPAIETIPVMIIEMATVEDRASAFIGHNRDRVAMTAMQIHYASLAAGDPVAVAMDEACRRAGVTIRKTPPANGIYKPGETVAVKAVEAVVTKKGAAGGARVLKVLVDAGRAPLSANEIKAVTALLYEPEWKDQVNEFDLATVIRSKQPDAWAGWAEANVRKGMPMALWRAIAIAWFKAVPKKRGAKPVGAEEGVAASASLGKPLPCPLRASHDA
ncbi:MAG TPA: hypothetical protein DDZ88_12150 [Verrucomicrobiales bacterium]|nr:hypothetical protein [Verrucomicrobiales bacterium]